MTSSSTYIPKPLVLVILDGWGHREATDHNAIAAAKTPVWKALIRDYPNGLINASEKHVGLPDGQMGNSEVGHMNIGSGRVLMQDLPRIDAAIADRSIEKNPALLQLIEKTKAGTGVCHVMGLVSPGGVHSHQEHIVSIAKLLAVNGLIVNIHAILDGRDTPPQSALEYIGWMETEIEKLPNVSIATVCGRYYAMDRDKRWDRVEKAYNAMVIGAGERYASAKEAIEKSYKAKLMDEFLLPCIIGDYDGMKDGDGFMCGNFRADRVREILTAMLDPAFFDFPRAGMAKFAATAGLTEYSSKLSPFIPALFAPQPLDHILGEIVSNAGMKQLRIAETEKYAHVTFFFNGGREQEFPGEERILVPSPKVATYDMQPEMSAYEVTDKLLGAIATGKFDLIVVNYANTDMVGHTGDIKAASRAVEAVDACLGKVTEAVLAKNGALLITADHGNAEMMFDNNTDQPHTAHTLNLVPALIIGKAYKGKKIPIPEGRLSDVAPTLLDMLGMKKPESMTGRSLLSHA